MYRGVLPEYPQMVEELTAGPVLALEVAVRDGGSAGVSGGSVEALRELCGPADPEVARVLRPKTLRAQFGADKARFLPWRTRNGHPGRGSGADAPPSLLLEPRVRCPRRVGGGAGRRLAAPG